MAGHVSGCFHAPDTRRGALARDSSATGATGLDSSNLKDLGRLALPVAFSVTAGRPAAPSCSACSATPRAAVQRVHAELRAAIARSARSLPAGPAPPGLCAGTRRALWDS